MEPDMAEATMRTGITDPATTEAIIRKSAGERDCRMARQSLS